MKNLDTWVTFRPEVEAPKSSTIVVVTNTKDDPNLKIKRGYVVKAGDDCTDVQVDDLIVAQADSCYPTVLNDENLICVLEKNILFIDLP